MGDEEVEKMTLVNPFMKPGFKGEEKWVVKVRGQGNFLIFFFFLTEGPW